MTNKQTYLLALLSALLLWLAWPPIPFTTPLLLIGLVPLLLAVNAIKSDSRQEKGKRIFRTAGLTFLVWNTASIYWVYNAVSAYNNVIVAFLVTLIPFGLGALLMTLAVWLYFRLSLHTSRRTAYLGLISFYIGMEYLHQSWDFAFPWMNLGNGFSGMHQLAQWYEYTGVYGGTLWILLSNILAYEAFVAFKTHKGYLRLRPGILWLIVVIVPAAISLIKYFGYTEKQIPVNVVTVQPNIDPYQKFGAISASDQLNILTHLSDSVAQPNTEYFIWPETAVPNFADEEEIRNTRDFATMQTFLSKYKNGTLITGIESTRKYPDQRTPTAQLDPNSGMYKDTFNAAIQVENSANVQFYHKSKLVPGVEKMPFPEFFTFLAPVFSELGGSVGGFGWQDAPAVFYSQNGVGVDPVICYESIWGDWIRNSVKQGAQFIAIITNDGWWGNTSGKDQHLLYATLRAIETRRYVVRSANTGISAFINQRGDVIQESKWWTRSALKADVNLNDELTFYVKNGDLIAIVASGIAFILALIIPYKTLLNRKKVAGATAKAV
jgi:apolipoprotein N-acyltransferase